MFNFRMKIDANEERLRVLAEYAEKRVLNQMFHAEGANVVKRVPALLELT